MAIFLNVTREPKHHVSKLWSSQKALNVWHFANRSDESPVRAHEPSAPLRIKSQQLTVPNRDFSPELPKAITRRAGQGA